MCEHFQQYTSVRLSAEYRGVLTEAGIRLGMLMIDNRLSMPVPVLELVHYQAGLHYTDEWKDLSLLAPSKDERKRFNSLMYDTTHVLDIQLHNIYTLQMICLPWLSRPRSRDAFTGQMEGLSTKEAMTSAHEDCSRFLPRSTLITALFHDCLTLQYHRLLLLLSPAEIN